MAPFLLLLTFLNRFTGNILSKMDLNDFYLHKNQIEMIFLYLKVILMLK